MHGDQEQFTGNDNAGQYKESDRLEMWFKCDNGLLAGNRKTPVSRSVNSRKHLKTGGYTDLSSGKQVSRPSSSVPAKVLHTVSWRPLLAPERARTERLALIERLLCLLR